VPPAGDQAFNMSLGEGKTIADLLLGAGHFHCQGYKGLLGAPFQPGQPSGMGRCLQTHLPLQTTEDIMICV
jgi:hypothetical protein